MRFLEIIRALSERQVRFIVVGGVAVLLHGVPRTTVDLDILLDLAPENVERLVGALEALGFRPRAPVAPRDLGNPALREEWVRDKGMKAFSFWHPRGGEVDVLLDVPVDFDVAARDKVSFDLGDLRVDAASIDVLIRMKESTEREQDRSDVKALEQIRKLLEDGHA